MTKNEYFKQIWMEFYPYFCFILIFFDVEMEGGSIRYCGGDKMLSEVVENRDKVVLATADAPLTHFCIIVIISHYPAT